MLDKTLLTFHHGQCKPINLAAICYKIELENERFTKFIKNLFPTTQHDPPATTPPTMMLMPPMLPMVSITKPIQQHFQTLDHFEETLQQLRKSMAQLDAVFNCINQSHQPMTNNRLIVSSVTPSHAPHNAKPPHPHPFPANALPAKIGFCCPHWNLWTWTTSQSSHPWPPLQTTPNISIKPPLLTNGSSHLN